VAVLVGVGVGVAVAVGVGVAVAVGVGVAVAVGVGVAVAVGVGVAVAVGVGVAVAVGVGVAVAVGVGVAVAVGVAVGVGVVVAVGVVQASLTIVLVFKVTAPFRANSWPWMLAPFFALIEMSASTDPTKEELVPKDADEPTCQKTLQAWAPPVKIIELAVAVVSVDAVLKINTALESPSASRVKFPVMLNFSSFDE
jgi:hypothetical protein